MILSEGDGRGSRNGEPVPIAAQLNGLRSAVKHSSEGRPSPRRVRGPIATGGWKHLHSGRIH
eukprot:3652332-Alexandrium_andersonii.AAC.1